MPFNPEQLPNDAVPVLYKAEMGGAFTTLPTTVNGNFLEAQVTGFSWVIPGFAATKPRMVYALEAAGSFSPGGLASYRIDKTIGSLSGPTSTALTGEAPTSVIAHPSRRFAYVTNAGSNTANGIAPNSVSVYPLSIINGKVVGPATDTVSTGAPIGFRPTMPTIHPSGKFLYVMNFGSASNDGGGDMSVFTINGANGALTLSPTVISGGGAQATGIAFNTLGTFAYVAYAGSSSSNTFSSQVKVYSVDVATGALTGPISGVAAGVLGSAPWSIVVDPNGKFAYVVCLFTDELRTYSIDSTTGALTYLGSVSFTATSKPSALAADPFGRFVYAGRQSTFLGVNLQSYAIDASTGVPTLVNGVLTSCVGGACSGPVPVVADPQGQFVFANDVRQGLSAFRVNSTTGALTSAGNITNVFIPWNAGVGIPFTFGVTGTHPLWQNNCTTGCAMFHTGGGGGTPTNPNPPTSYHLSATQGPSVGLVTSTPAGIHEGTGPGNVPATHFPANSNVQLCATPPALGGPFDITWSGSCSGTGECASVSMNSDKSCHVEYTRH
jgi:6-phosphogluconolactonase (cycloisomerase 2 family)